MNFCKPTQKDRLDQGAGIHHAPLACVPRVFLVWLFLLATLPGFGANVRNYFLNPTNSAAIDTNYLVITKISTNILANGGVLAIGLPQRTSRAPWTNLLGVGFYSVTSPRINGAYVINVWDNGATLYDYTNLLHSGYNTYSVIAPTLANITNALGYVPGTNGVVVPDPNALTNNQSTHARFSSTVATPTIYTDRVEATNGSSIIIEAGGDTLTLSSDAASYNGSGGFVGVGSGLTALNASQLSSGTVPDARFPATLPAVSGANLTALPAAQLTGTIDDARLPASITSDITGNAATATTATNLVGNFNSATNTAENRLEIYVTGNASALVNGRYVQAWTNTSRYEAVWTNTASTNLIWMNENFAPTEINFKITDATNSVNYLASSAQILQHPSSSGTSRFIENPFDETPNAHFSAATPTTLTWGTNNISTNTARYLGTGNLTILPQYVPTNGLRVSLAGSDLLANRTNGIPFATLWAANNVATNGGDFIYVEEGVHRTFGVHMKRGLTIRGAGRNTIIEPMYDDDLNHATFFQSQLISIWDNCTLENLIITNGGIGFTQHEGTILGATNAVARDVEVYPAYLPDLYPEILQTSYFGTGVKFSRLGNNNRCERVRVYTSGVGFDFQSGVNATLAQSTFDLIDCQVIASPEYTGLTNYWLRTGMMGFGNTNIGGMIPIAFNLGNPGAEFNYSKLTVNIIGGRYTSINGGTNQAEYVGGETNISRNAGIWFARGHTNQIRVNFINNPEFVIGTTNAPYHNLFLNETTNNNVTLSGTVAHKQVRNGDRNDSGTNMVYVFATPVLTNYVPTLSYQAAYGTGTAATSSGSQELMNFGTTDPTLTVISSGLYEIKAAAHGITSSADGGTGCGFLVLSNTVTLQSIIYPGVDAALSGTVLPFTIPSFNLYSRLVAGDTVSLHWHSNGTDHQANSASITILRIAP